MSRRKNKAEFYGVDARSARASTSTSTVLYKYGVVYDFFDFVFTGTCMECYSEKKTAKRNLPDTDRKMIKYEKDTENIVLRERHLACFTTYHRARACACACAAALETSTVRAKVARLCLSPTNR